MFKKIEVWIVYLIVIFFIGFIILFSAVVRSSYVNGDLLVRFQPAAIFVAEIPSNFIKLFDISNINESYIEKEESTEETLTKTLTFQESNLELNIVNTLNSGYILVSGYNPNYKQPSIFLFDIANNKILHEWFYDRELLSDKNYRFQHPLLLENGDIITSSGEGDLIKLNFCSDLLWRNERHFHHSIEIFEENQIIVPTWYENTSYLKNYISSNLKVRDDGFAFVNLTNGEILKEYSLIKILLENGYEGLVTLAISQINMPDDINIDPIHLNDAEPILFTDKFVKKGDVMLSSRHLNFVALYRPSNNKIIFLVQGLFSMQHDLDYQGNGVFTFFGNDNIRHNSNDNRLKDSSSIYSYDMKTNKVEIIQDLSSIGIAINSQGLHEYVNNGIFLDTASQIFIVNEKNEILFNLSINLNEEKFGALHWSRYYENLDFINFSFDSKSC